MPSASINSTRSATPYTFALCRDGAAVRKRRSQWREPHCMQTGSHFRRRHRKDQEWCVVESWSGSPRHRRATWMASFSGVMENKPVSSVRMPWSKSERVGFVGASTFSTSPESSCTSGPEAAVDQYPYRCWLWLPGFSPFHSWTEQRQSHLRCSTPCIGHRSCRCTSSYCADRCCLYFGWPQMPWRAYLQSLFSLPPCSTPLPPFACRYRAPSFVGDPGTASALLGFSTSSCFRFKKPGNFGEAIAVPFLTVFRNACTPSSHDVRRFSPLTGFIFSSVPMSHPYSHVA